MTDSLLDQLADIGDDVDADRIPVAEWVARIGLARDEFYRAMEETAAGVFGLPDEAMPTGEQVAAACTIFQLGVEWGRRYAP